MMPGPEPRETAAAADAYTAARGTAPRNGRSGVPRRQLGPGAPRTARSPIAVPPQRRGAGVPPRGVPRTSPRAPTERSRGTREARLAARWRRVARHGATAAAVVLTVLLMRSTIGVYVIPSGSMETTLRGCAGCENDRVLVDKVSLWVSPPRPGEVVVFHGPDGWLGEGGVTDATGLVAVLEQVGALVGITPPGSADFVKRVVAVGGQTVQCCDPQGRVVVDGSPLEEPYVHLDPRTGRSEQVAFGPVQVPEGHVGDG